jgi:nitric oxide reductase activation protein
MAVPPLPEIFGVIRPRRVLAAGPTEEAGAPTPGDLARQRPVEDELPECDEDQETESLGKILKLFSSPLQNPLMAKLMKKLGAAREPGTGAGGAELPTGASRRTTRPGSKAELSMLPASLLPTEVVSDRGWGWRYPEWDEYGNRYRTEWCTVMEVDPRSEDLRLFDPPTSSDLRRRLARLGVGLERRRRQPQGDDIDLDAAVESRVELLAGSTPDDGVYVDSQRRRRSLAVLLLLDVTGSVAEQSSALGSAHEQQRRAAAMFLDTLHSLGDRVALYGFRSQGRSSVYLIRVKTFDEIVNAVTYERLGGLTPGGYTRLGAAIRHGAHVLTTQAGTDRRLLVVLSDGFPYDDGYEGAYAEADARRALAETRRQGVGCLCLTLGASTAPKGLRRVFGTAAYANAPRLEDLAEDIGPMFRKAMASADLQRRLGQRHRQGVT